MEIKFFNKWSSAGINVVDPALKKYINLSPLIVPKTGGRYTETRFWKSKYTIVERLINKLMVPGHKGKKHFITSGHICGKAAHSYKIVESVFKLIEEKTKKNPIEVFVKAVENAAPREEITTIEYGGARYPQAVDCSPQRRVDQAIKFMVQGSFVKSFGKKISIVESLSEEIISAYTLSNKSHAITKKFELERQSDGAR